MSKAAEPRSVSRLRCTRPQRQRGIALLVLLSIVTMGTLMLFISNLTPLQLDAQRQGQTELALQEARDALIGYALRIRDLQASQDVDSDGDDDKAMYGFLPLPDMGSSRNGNVSCTGEGCEANTPTGIAYDANGLLPTLVGRLPWRTLGVRPLRDGAGECLWLMVAAPHLQKRQSLLAGPALNWDTLGQFDIVIANGSSALASTLSSAHQRPVAVIYAPGPALSGQNRGTDGSGDDVSECGGNYDAANYLDPQDATTLTNVSNYLDGSNHASASIGDSNRSNDPDTAKSLVGGGKLFVAGSNFRAGACSDANCTLLANDTALALTGDQLFAAMRKSNGFRTDINAQLERIKSCLRDQIAAGTSLSPGRVPVNAACYGDEQPPKAYWTHYKEMLFAASGSYNVNGQPCAGVLIFAGQRGAGQSRVTDAERNTAPSYFANYLEGDNLLGFQSGSTSFAGPETLQAVSVTQAASQDIVQCLASGGSFSSVQSTALTSAGIGQLTSYSAATGTLTLGQAHTGNYGNAVRTDLYGCAWQSETHDFAAGLRAYFKFRLNDQGFSSTPHEGFVFALVDGDNNSTSACGAALQHLGYSGNNYDTPYIVPPKLGIEIDPRRNFRNSPAYLTLDPAGFAPGYVSSTVGHLSNGRADPNYTGGHVAALYWGGENAIDTGRACGGGCTAPMYCGSGGTCFLPAEEDDNVHNRGSNRSGFAAAPRNPSAAGTPTAGTGVYKLDPNLSSVPSNTDFHVRVEVTRGLPPLDPVRVATTANLNLNAPGASIDGITLVAGDRILVKDQNTTRQNGVYVWQGASTALSRASDADSAGELVGAVVSVGSGSSNAGTLWRQSNAPLVLGTSAIAWTQLQSTQGLVAPGLLSARVASTGNVALSSPGSSIDGVSLTSGDRVLLKDQSIASDNGLYVWTAAGSTLTRASEADSAAELTGAVVQIVQGTSNANSLWRQTTTNLTLGSDALRWANLRVKVAAPGNLSLSSPGASIDGIRMSSGDRVLLKAQSTGSENGIYIWTGASSALTLASDADSSAELAGLTVQVQQGAEAGGWWRYDGSAWGRQSVRVATQAPLDLTNPGASIDGVSMVNGDRVLVKAQATAAENGIYVWTGAAVAMSRASSHDSAAELAGALIQVLEGSDTGRAWRQSDLLAGGTLGADAVRWQAIDGLAQYRVEVWLLPDSSTDANQIAAMQNTTRPMSQLYPSFAAHLRDQPTIGYPFRRARLGFTTGQSRNATDQTVTVTNFSSTWLP